MRITFFEASWWSIQLYAASWLLLSVQAWVVRTPRDFVIGSVLYPVLVFSAMGLINFLYFATEAQASKHVEVNRTIALGPLLIPLPLTGYAWVVTQTTGSYESVAWVAMVVAASLGRDLAQWLRMRQVG